MTTAFLTNIKDSLGVSPQILEKIDNTIILLIIAGGAIVLDMILRWSISKIRGIDHLKGVIIHLIHLIPLIIVYILLPSVFPDESNILIFGKKISLILMTLTIVLSLNSSITALSKVYREKDTRHKPIKGAVQVVQFILFTIGAIISIAILLDKSPAKLLAGLGASTAVLMLIFKDSILGFVAGIQLSINDMVRIGDWIVIPDGSANGIVEEITLNTVKIRNWDNTISTIPPYNLISNTFTNWRGMLQSGGRQVDKTIRIDSHTVKFCDKELIEKIKTSLPLMGNITFDKDNPVTNSQLFRNYMEQYLSHHPQVNNCLDIITTITQQNEYGVSLRAYFFIRNKEWKSYETIQSDIIDNLLASVQIFDLELYQKH